MSRIQPKHIASARIQVEPLTDQKTESLAEEVFAKQPNLLGSVLVLPQFGVTHSQIDIALKVLFICHCAVKSAGVELPTITESDQERCLTRITGRARFLEGLNAKLSEQAVYAQIQDHREPHLLAVAYGILRDHDLVAVRTEPEKYLLLAVLNVVETISDAINDA